MSNWQPTIATFPATGNSVTISSGLKAGDILVCMWGGARSSGAFWSTFSIAGGDTTWVANGSNATANSGARGGAAWYKVVDATDISDEPFSVAITRSGGGSGVAQENIQVDQIRMNNGTLGAVSGGGTSGSPAFFGSDTAVTAAVNGLVDAFAWCGTFMATGGGALSNTNGPNQYNNLTTTYPFTSNGGANAANLVTQYALSVTGAAFSEFQAGWSTTTPWALLGFVFGYTIPPPVYGARGMRQAVAQASSWLIDKQPWKDRKSGLVVPGFADKRLVLAGA